ncbi:MAG: hypothetical protein AB7S38_37310 [Vulcanimicrobiota bacterium]
MSTLNAAGNQGQTQVRTARGATTTTTPRQAEGPTPSRNEMRAQALSNLREREAATPQGTGGTKTLTAQADRASQGRGTTLTDPAAIINHELKTAGLDDDFRRLSPRGQQQYLALARDLVGEGTRVNTGGGQPEMPALDKMTPEQRTQFQAQSGGTLARRNLMNLLEAGKLNDTDSQGRTLLSNLDHMRTDKYPKVDNKAALQSTLANVGARGGHFGHGPAVASSNASEYTRVSHELWLNGQSKLPNGDTVKVPTDPPQKTQGFGGFGGIGMGMAPGLMDVPRALSEYGKTQAAKPERLAEFRERAAAGLSGDQRTAYDQLSPAQRNQFLDLATRPGDRETAELARAFQTAPGNPMLNESVTTLLRDGKLTQKDTQGHSLLDNLSAIRGDGSNEFLYNQTTDVLAGRGFRATARDWTLPAEQKMRTDQPAEYARLVHGLTSGDHSVRTSDGQVLKGPTGEAGPFGGIIDPGRLLPEAMANRAIESGQPLTMVNSNGETFQAEFKHLRTNDKGNQYYNVAVGDHRFLTYSEAGSQTTSALLDLANFDSMTPKHLRGELSRVNIRKDANPSDEHFAERYGIEDFHAAATAGGNVINFWNGTSSLNEPVFNHEMGHLIGARRGLTDGVYDRMNFSDDAGNVPIGWGDRIKKDSQSVSDYGDKAIGEDFAESWEHYMRARLQGTAAVTKFKTEHPNRFQLLDRIYRDGDTW